MADKSNERDVLTSLPRTRPARRSTKRGAVQTTEQTSAEPASAVAAKKPAPAKKAAATKKPATAKKAAATKKPARPAAGKPAAKAQPAAKKSATPAPKPAAAVPPAGYATPAGAAQPPAGGSNDLLTTGVQAAEELASIGVTLLKQVAGSLASKLPKP